MIVAATILAVTNRGALGPDPHDTERYYLCIRFMLTQSVFERHTDLTSHRVFVRVHSPSPPLHPLDHLRDGGMTELGDPLVDDPPPACETRPVYEAPPV